MRNHDFSDKGIGQVVKTVVVALVLSVLLAAIFTLVLRVCPMGKIAVTVVSQLLKVLSLAVGVMLFVKGEKGLWKGVGCGLLFSMLGYLTFSALGGGFGLSWLIFAELFLYTAVGGLLGVVAVNLKKG